MLQETLETNFRRFKNFLGFSRGFVLRNNPFKNFFKKFEGSLKEILTFKKKLKMAQYRLNYHKHQLHKMEALIAENSSHTFIKGKNINQIR